MAVRDFARRADGFGLVHRRLGLGLVLIVVVGGRLELRFAEVPLDAVAVEQPEGGARIEPRQHDHVALHGAEEEPAGVVGAEVVEVGHDRDFEVRLHQERRDDALFERPLGRVLARRLRQDDGESMARHDVLR